MLNGNDDEDDDDFGITTALIKQQKTARKIPMMAMSKTSNSIKIKTNCCFILILPLFFIFVNACTQSFNITNNRILRTAPIHMNSLVILGLPKHLLYYILLLFSFSFYLACMCVT